MWKGAQVRASATLAAFLRLAVPRHSRGAVEVEVSIPRLRPLSRSNLRLKGVDAKKCSLKAAIKAAIKVEASVLDASVLESSVLGVCVLEAKAVVKVESKAALKKGVSQAEQELWHPWQNVGAKKCPLKTAVESAVKAAVEATIEGQCLTCH